MEKKVFILSGLPGSGKTTFANNIEMEQEHVFVFHQDDKSSQWWLYEPYEHETVIIDALNLTNDDIIKCINDVKKRLNKRWNWSWTIIRWKEDRTKCLRNDKGRREISSKHTIQKATFEIPDLARIKKETGIYQLMLEEREIVLKPNYMEHISKEKYRIKGKYLLSDEWLISGTSRSYDSNWDEVHSNMVPDDVPEFTELYDLLEDVCPNISFLDFRKIQKECVEIITYEDNDYYSRTTNSYYRCNLDKMFEMIREQYNL